MGAGGATLLEVAPGVSVEDVRKATAAEINVAKDVGEMRVS